MSLKQICNFGTLRTKNETCRDMNASYTMQFFHNLGIEEWNNGRFERAAKHFIIAANLEYNDSLKGL